MFPKDVYIERRNKLKESLNQGIILFLGNKECPMNYPGNTYPFRQDSSFLYYFGIDQPDLVAIIDIDHDAEIVYGNELNLEEMIWMGQVESLSDKCLKSGIKQVKPYERLSSDISKIIVRKQKINYLPPYRGHNILQLSNLLDMKFEKIKENTSEKLIYTVVAQRSVKDKYEVAEMESTMNNVTNPAYLEAIKKIKPGINEFEISGLIESIVLSHNCSMAYPIICSINGHILHNHYHGNVLEYGQLLLIDAGAESPMHYATDITRTIPVSGKFDNRQKDIYNIVLHAELESIKAIKPGIPYQKIHLNAARIITEGLKGLGLMKGNVEDAVAKGAHALFFPHGLGHMIGLDVHDMEDIGEEYVGYDHEIKRIDQFGTAYLRLGKKLQTGFVITVEPGIYFIPVLIDKWSSDGRYRDYINYDKVRQFVDFGGIRIEDNVLVTNDAYQIIGRPIAKNIQEIENHMVV